MHKYKGKLITLEGPDTAGKTTLINKLRTVLPIIYPNETFLFTREPGNLLQCEFNQSETIRTKLLTDDSLTAKQQAELFAQARYYHVLDIIKELEKGNNVITDRFLFSSVIYQGLELGFKAILKYNKDSLDLLKQNDIEINNIVLQITEDTYKKRMSTRAVKDAMEDVEEKTIIERINYHNIVRTLNEDLDNQLGNVYTIDANDTAPTVVIEALNHINKIIR